MLMQNHWIGFIMEFTSFFKLYMLLDLLSGGIRAVSWWLTCSVHIVHTRTVVRVTTISWTVFPSGYAEPCWVGPWRPGTLISPLSWKMLHHSLRSKVPDCKWLFPERETFGDQQPCYILYVIYPTHHTSPPQKQSRSFRPFLSISLSA